MSKKILAALLAVLMVLTIVPMTAFAAEFDDTTGHWGQASIERWAEVGILNGKGDGKFDPNGSMTRAEFAQMLVNMMGYTEKAENVFNDVPAGSWYEDAVLKLVAAGVLNGTAPDKANPNGKITREQTAVMLCRAFGIKPSANATLTFKDSASVSSWARDAVAALAERGMMNGIGNNTAAPKLDINRASVAKLADNMITHYVTEDTTITGEVKGIVLVAGGATVTLSDATVEAPVVVAPKAEEVTVALAGETTVESVAVAAENAAVTVADTATVGAVSVEAPSATAEIAGKVETVTVAEAAESAAVTVADTAEVGEVAVEAPSATADIAGKVESVTVAEAAESAAVTVAKTAEVGTVSVEAPKATTEIAGKADSVTVAGTAESAKVNVPGTVGTVKTEAANTDVKVDGTANSVTVAGENAKVDVAGTVGTVSTEAANTNVSVSGTVSKVDVAEGADKANISTTGTAKIENVTTSAEDVKVSGTGSVGNVTANKGSADVTTPGTTVKNEGADNVTAGGKPVETGKEETTKPSTPSGGNSGGSTPTVVTDPSVTTAIFHDTRAEVADSVEGKTYVSDNALKDGYSISNRVVDGVTEVTVNHQNIWQHKNAQDTLGYWTGYAIKAPEGATKFKYIKAENKTTEPSTEVAQLEDIDQKGTEGVAVYYNVGDAEDKDKEYFGVQWGTPNAETHEVEYTATKWYHVNWNVTCRPEVSNVKLTVVENRGDVAKLPKAAQTALCLQDFLDKTDLTAETDDMPWLVVTYDRNVASAITFEATSTAGATTDMNEKTSLATIGVDRVQSWSLNPQTGSVGKLWSEKPDTLSGEYTLTLKSGSTVLKTVSYDYTASGETVVNVTFGSNTYPVAQGGKVTAPAVPENTADTYYTGKWVTSTTPAISVNAEEEYTVPEAVTGTLTFTAESKTIEKATLAARPDGNAEETQDFKYGDTYTAAGIGFTATEGSGTGTITVDQKTAVQFITDESKTTAREAITVESGGEKAECLFIGVAVKAPNKNVTKLLVNGTEKTIPVASGDGQDTFKDKDGNVYFIDYYPAIKADGTACAAKTWDAKTLVWMTGDEGEEEVVKVETMQVSRAAATLETVDTYHAEVLKKNAAGNYDANGTEDINVVDNGNYYTTFRVVDGQGAQFDIVTENVIAIAKGGDNGIVTVYKAVEQKNGSAVPNGPQEYFIDSNSTENVNDHRKGWTLKQNSQNGPVPSQDWYFWTTKGEVLKVNFSYTPSTDNPTE